MKKAKQKEVAGIVALWAFLVWILYYIGRQTSAGGIGETGLPGKPDNRGIIWPNLK